MHKFAEGSASIMFDFGQANDEQKRAIQHIDGPALIIAGPGTGKTFTLVKRVVYLIVEKGIKPENILIATFTEKAAKELITRITNELLKLDIKVNVNELYIGTFHSICLRLIKENVEYTRLKKNYRLMDEFDQQYLIYRNHKAFDVIPNLELIADKTRVWEKAKQLSYYFNAISEELITVEDLRKDKEPSVQVLAMAYEVYQELLAEENAMDFSSIQVIAYNLLQDNEAVRTKIQEQIQYAMIDEYQDTNYVQEQLIFSIVEKHHNLCVVGDDDQGLYRFRGATIRNILEFPNKWAHCAKLNLVENYRSEKDIVKFYNEWMQDTKEGNFEWNNFRYGKVIVPSKPNQVEGVPTVIKVSGQRDLKNWGDRIIDFIEKLQANKTITNYNQIAFLFWSVKNDRVKNLADYLEKKGIPVYSPRSDMFFEREEIKLLIGTLLVLFPNYLKAMQTDKYMPKVMAKYYTEKCLPAFIEFQRTNPNAPLIKWCANKGGELSSPNKTFDYAFTGLVYEALQFEPFLSIMQSDISGVADSRAIRNLAEFTKLTTRYEYLHKINVFTSSGIEIDINQFFNRYLMFLYEGGIGEYEDDSEYAPSGCVSFMTIHQSKGMEFPVVIVGSLYTTPRNNFKEVIQELERNVYERKPFEPYECIKYYDFWRLYYTAFSRAQNLLALTADECEGRGREPSKYFEKYYEELPNYWNTDIDYSKIKCEPVKDVNIKQSYSFTSHISVYENCSLQYKFFKDLGFIPVREGATMFGTLVHATIEDIHKAAMRGESQTITEDNVNAWFADNYETISKKEQSYLSENVRAAALRQVLRYVDRQSAHWDRVRDAEVEVSHVEEDYILSGKVDLIEGENGTLDIVDFKAEKKPDLIHDKNRIDLYKRQLQIYAYIIEQQIGMPVSRLRLYYTGDETSGVPEIIFPNEHAKVQETIDEFTNVVHKIQCRDYSTYSTSQTMCNNCDLRHFCQKIKS
jgi:DNA helicase-2/ATP-dependent DNA helicase PcrA